MAGFLNILKDLLFVKSDNTVIGLSQLRERKQVEPEPKKMVKKPDSLKISDLIRGQS